MAGSSKKPAPADDDLRDRFREALERKQGKGPHAGRASDGEGKAHGPSDNLTRQRQFRRKSGG